VDANVGGFGGGRKIRMGEIQRERKRKTRAASAVQRYLGAALIIVLGWGYQLHPHRTGLYM
jgi:hypothetical protein